jgi:hypothetical protein
MRGWRGWAGLGIALAATGACDLNPQPLPPEENAAADGGAQHSFADAGVKGPSDNGASADASVPRSDGGSGGAGVDASSDTSTGDVAPDGETDATDGGTSDGTATDAPNDAVEAGD